MEPRRPILGGCLCAIIGAVVAVAPVLLIAATWNSGETPGIEYLGLPVILVGTVLVVIGVVVFFKRLADPHRPWW